MAFSAWLLVTESLLFSSDTQDSCLHPLVICLLKHRSALSAYNMYSVDLSAA